MSTIESLWVKAQSSIFKMGVEFSLPDKHELILDLISKHHCEHPWYFKFTSLPRNAEIDFKSLCSRRKSLSEMTEDVSQLGDKLLLLPRKTLILKL